MRLSGVKAELAVVTIEIIGSFAEESENKVEAVWGKLQVASTYQYPPPETRCINNVHPRHKPPPRLHPLGD